MAEGEVEQGPWMTLSEAASRSGLHREALRARAKRGQIPSRRGNASQVLVQLPPDLLNAAHGAAQGVAQAQVEQLAEVVHDLEGELGELRERLARVEAERDAAARTGEVEARLLREALADARAERDRMAELLHGALHRPTWLERFARVMRATRKPDAGPKGAE